MPSRPSPDAPPPQASPQASQTASAATPPWTNKALLEWTTRYLHDKGIEAPLKEARMLLAHVLGCLPIDVVARSHEEPTVAQRQRYKELIRQRVEGCPTAYLVGTREFYLLKFQVTPAVLIPRPETELLVQLAIEGLKRELKTKPAARLLDLGTGSGCIAISLVHQLPHVTAVAVDLSPDALAVAQLNARTHQVAERIDFRRGDLFEPIRPGELFDWILSNPPYIAPAEFPELSKEVRDFEPRQALEGGADGLAFYRRIAQQAAKYLCPGGSLLLEIGHTQADSVTEILRQAGFPSVQLERDWAGRPRALLARQPVAEPRSCSKE